MNKVELDGFIGKDPQIRTTKNGNEFAVFRLATNENYMNAMGSWQENTTWHNVVLWSEQLEDVKDHLKTGMRLHIHGRISSRSYTDKNGDRKYVTEIVGKTVEYISTETESVKN